MSDEKMELRILGRNVGHFTGWDINDTLSLQFYGFEPADNIQIPATDCLSVNYESGLWEIMEDNGDIKASGDIVQAVVNILRDAEAAE